MNKTLSSSTYLNQTSREYAIYTCDSRGIPFIGDGLKAVQRTALWLLRNRADKIKTFSLGGLMGVEKLYVHGEASANKAIGLLAAPYANNVPLIEGKGQFGSKLLPREKGIGAPRYTDVKRAKASEVILYADLDIVPLIDNYDGTTKQPEHFLPLIPLVLLNGANGIAVGWSTNILRRSLVDLVAATKAALMGKKIPTLIPSYAHYDLDIRPTGQPNQWIFYGRAEILDTSTIRVTELPTGLSITDFRKRLIKMEEQDKIKTFIDRSAASVNITIKMERGSVRDWTVDQAIEFFKLYSRDTERLVVVDWNGTRIRQYESAEEVVEQFAAWRLGWYTTRYEKLVADQSYELIYWLALRLLLEGGFPSRLGTFESRAEMENDVLRTISLGDPDLTISDDQLDRILNIATYRWTKKLADEVTDRITGLERDIRHNQAVLASPEALRKVYIDELNAINPKKLGLE